MAALTVENTLLFSTYVAEKTAENGKSSDNGKLNKKKRKIFQKYTMTNAREVAQLTETLKHKVQAKAQRITRYKKKGNPVYSE